MSADNEEQQENPRPRFTAAEARERAEQARAKAEFILSRAYGLLRETNKEWAQIKGEETTIPNICQRMKLLVIPSHYGKCSIRLDAMLPVSGVHSPLHDRPDPSPSKIYNTVPSPF